ncbi:MAG: hypothetical protein ACQEQF_10310 [Bacillota bacterium]
MKNNSFLAILDPEDNFKEKNLTQTLAEMGIKTDIIKREIKNEKYLSSKDKIEYNNDYKNLRTIRLPFGGKKALKSKDLWPHLNKYISEIIQFYEEENKYPDTIYTNTSTGGLGAVIFNQKTNIPFIFSTNSLGAQKMDKLKINKNNFMKMIDKYKLHRQIAAEKVTINKAQKIVIKNRQERFEKYSHPLYKNALDIENDNKFIIINPNSKNNLKKNYIKLLEELSKDKSNTNGDLNIPEYFLNPDFYNDQILLHDLKENYFKNK